MLSATTIIAMLFSAAMLLGLFLYLESDAPSTGRKEKKKRRP